MISYNWAAQKPIIALKQQLEAKGYRVWLDIESMAGSTLEAMAKAVESSHVFCMAMSRKYKESANCRAEAEYAFNLRKPIIPVLVEPNYRPDGWLGAILGTKMYYDLTSAMKISNGGAEIDINEDAFAKIMPGILKDVSSQLPKGISSGAPIVPSSPTAASQTVSTVATWDEKAVLTWLQKCGLANLMPVFKDQGIDGVALEELRRLSKDPSVFYSACEKYLRITTLGPMLHLSAYLRQLDY